MVVIDGNVFQNQYNCQIVPYEIDNYFFLLFSNAFPIDVRSSPLLCNKTPAIVFILRTKNNLTFFHFGSFFSGF